MKKNYKEIAKRVQKAVEYVANKKVNHKEGNGKIRPDVLTEIIQEAVEKYGISENMIRAVGGWSISTVEDLMQIWYDAEEEERNGNEDEAMRLKYRFRNSYNKLNIIDKEYIDEFLEMNEIKFA